MLQTYPQQFISVFPLRMLLRHSQARRQSQAFIPATVYIDQPIKGVFTIRGWKAGSCFISCLREQKRYLATATRLISPRYGENEELLPPPLFSLSNRRGGQLHGESVISRPSRRAFSDRFFGAQRVAARGSVFVTPSRWPVQNGCGLGPTVALTLPRWYHPSSPLQPVSRDGRPRIVLSLYSTKKRGIGRPRKSPTSLKGISLLSW